MMTTVHSENGGYSVLREGRGGGASRPMRQHARSRRGARARARHDREVISRETTGLGLAGAAGPSAWPAGRSRRLPAARRARLTLESGLTFLGDLRHEGPAAAPRSSRALELCRKAQHRRGHDNRRPPGYRRRSRGASWAILVPGRRLVEGPEHREDDRPKSLRSRWRRSGSTRASRPATR